MYRQPVRLFFSFLFLASICNSPDFSQEIKEEWPTGEWFSQIQKLPNGFDAKEIFLTGGAENGKFIMARISYNLTRNWEELRYSGKWEKISENKILLKTEYCTLYGAREIGNRWALIRAFDCDHLRFEITKTSADSILLNPGMLLEGKDSFSRPANEKNSLPSLVILVSGKEFLSWSINLNRVRKGATSYIVKKNGNRENVQIIETVDSSGKYKTLSGEAEIGDFLILKNKKESNPLE